MSTKRHNPFSSTTSNQYLAILLVTFVFLTTTACTKKQISYSPQSTATSDRSPVDKDAIKDADATKGADATKDALKTFYAHWRGTPYRYGGMSRSEIDCSGLTVLAYKDIFGLHLPRTVVEQAAQGNKIPRSSLQPGDLVFFKTGIFQRHVGIYLENSKFIHASSSKGVMISSLDEPYWQKQYWRANRVYRF